VSKELKALPTEYPPGRLIGGRYRIDSMLGEGGTAFVFRAHDLATQTDIALKVIKSRFMRDARAATRLAREGEMLRQLAHPGIVRVDTWGSHEEGPFFLAMELLSGETLASRLGRGPLELLELDQILRQIFGAIQAAHRAEIIHRDLKPENIFLSVGEAGSQVRLLDFGISKAVGAEKLTQTGQMLGTPRYMAPEQLAAAANVDVRADIYGIGMIAYEALSGRSAFSTQEPMGLIVEILHGRRASLRTLVPGVPAGIEAVIERSIQVSPDTRYASVERFQEAWVEALQDSSYGRPRGARKERVSTAVMGLFTDPALVPHDSEDRISEPSGTFSDLVDLAQAEGVKQAAAAKVSNDGPRRSTGTVDAETTAQPGVESLRRVSRPSLSSSLAGREAQADVAGQPERRRAPSLSERQTRVEAGQNQEVGQARSTGPSRSGTNVGFWRSLRRVHFLAMLLFAIAGAVTAGFVVWKSVESRRATIGRSVRSVIRPPPPLPVTKQPSGPDSVLTSSP